MMRKAVRRILVAVDFRESRNAAFYRALTLAREWSAELYVLQTGVPRPASRFPLSGEDVDVERSETELSLVRALVRSSNDHDVPVQVITAREDDPARAIAAQAHLVMADLVVVSRDLGSSRMWPTARVAASVARSAPVPVLIVPPRKGAPRGSGTPFKNVVVGVDFTVASAVALRVASELIAEESGRGTVVHAISFASPLAFSGGEAPAVAADLRDEMAEAEARLCGAVPPAARHLVQPRVVTGAAGQAILDVAAEVDADLVVMGVARRTRLDELVFGSTFRKVVRRSLRPILAIPVAAGAYRWTGEFFARPINDGCLRVA
jgi:nucleotide-binding universal stress UspA family protein